MHAYTEYGNAVKKVYHLATRIAAGRGLPHSVEPLTPDKEAIEALSDAEGERGRAWELCCCLATQRRSRLHVHGVRRCGDWCGTRAAS
jgi:hypothetical protein